MGFFSYLLLLYSIFALFFSQSRQITGLAGVNRFCKKTLCKFILIAQVYHRQADKHMDGQSESDISCGGLLPYVTLAKMHIVNMASL